MSKSKPYHESFARFLEAPTRDGLRELLKNNPGESRTCDFKAQWPEASSVAKHLLGMANSGGGCVVVGVAEADDGTLMATGLERLKDKADVTKSIAPFLPTPLLAKVDVVDFAYDASEYPTLVGKRFQVLFVDDDATHLPFVATRDGAGVRLHAIYVRREALTEEANHDELQALINRRLATGHSTQREIDLRTHLEQLRILYSSLETIQWEFLTSLLRNPRYPKEDFEGFVLRMIEEKKRRIRKELDTLI